MSEFNRRRQNRKDASMLFDRAKDDIFSCHPAHERFISQDGVDVQIDGERHRYIGGYCYSPTPSPTPEYERAHDRITENFIYRCLENGMGIQDREELLKYAMAIGVVLSERDQILAVGFLKGGEGDIDEPIIKKDLVEMAVSLVGLDRMEGKTNARFSDHYQKLVDCYRRMAGKTYVRG